MTSQPHLHMHTGSPGPACIAGWRSHCGSVCPPAMHVHVWLLFGPSICRAHAGMHMHGAPDAWKHRPAERLVVLPPRVVGRVLPQRQVPEAAANLIARLPNLDRDELARHG